MRQLLGGYALRASTGHACAVAGGRVPEDYEGFLPWNRGVARLPCAAPGEVVDGRAA